MRLVRSGQRELHARWVEMMQENALGTCNLVRGTGFDGGDGTEAHQSTSETIFNNNES